MPDYTEEDVREVAKAICKSRTYRGGECCEWPGNMGLRPDCPVSKGYCDEAAIAAIEAVNSLTYTAGALAMKEAAAKVAHANGQTAWEGAMHVDCDGVIAGRKLAVAWEMNVVTEAIRALPVPPRGSKI